MGFGLLSCSLRKYFEKKYCAHTGAITLCHIVSLVTTDNVLNVEVVIFPAEAWVRRDGGR